MQSWKWHWYVSSFLISYPADGKDLFLWMQKEANAYVPGAISILHHFCPNNLYWSYAGCQQILFCAYINYNITKNEWITLFYHSSRLLISMNKGKPHKDKKYWILQVYLPTIVSCTGIRAQPLLHPWHSSRHQFVCFNTVVMTVIQALF